jgi:hypothetical protein
MLSLFVRLTELGKEFAVAWSKYERDRNTTDVHKFHAKIPADRRQIRMHARPHVGIELRLALLRAKNDVKNDLTE